MSTPNIAMPVDKNLLRIVPNYMSVLNVANIAAPTVAEATIRHALSARMLKYRDIREKRY